MDKNNAGPLGRESMKFKEKMQKYHAAMEFNLYAAEIECPFYGKRQDAFALGWSYRCEEVSCPFSSEHQRCRLTGLRIHLGDHVVQHDIQENQ